MEIKNIITAIFLGAVLVPVASAQQVEVKAAYDKACATCHQTGIGGAPRLGDAAAWKERVSGGMGRLYKSALEGTPKGMPAKGGADGRSLTDNEVRAVVDFMVDKVRDVLKDAPGTASSVASAAKPLAPIPFSFNRMLKQAAARNLAPVDDGIHDPANAGTLMLQPPLQGMAELVRSNFGNNTDWVASLESKKIAPRWERTNAMAEGIVMDLNILRVPKGSMPNVVFPHKQHTEWLECSNCHPAIFVPQKGANIINMPLIMLGQKCGVCHGKVAFPVSQCAKCHSQKRDVPQKAAGTKDVPQKIAGL